MFDQKNLVDVCIADSALIKYPELCKFGKHISVDHGFYSTVQMQISDYVHLGPYVCVIGGKSANLYVGEFVAIGAGTKIICSSDDPQGTGLFGPASVPKEYQNQKINKPVIIERFASIAVNVIIMPGVTIAEGSVIMPNSIVRKNTKPWTAYYGNPLRAYRKRDPGQRPDFAKQLGYE